MFLKVLQSDIIEPTGRVLWGLGIGEEARVGSTGRIEFSDRVWKESFKAQAPKKGS